MLPLPLLLHPPSMSYQQQLDAWNVPRFRNTCNHSCKAGCFSSSNNTRSRKDRMKGHGPAQASLFSSPARSCVLRQAVACARRWIDDPPCGLPLLSHSFLFPLASSATDGWPHALLFCSLFHPIISLPPSCQRLLQKTSAENVLAMHTAAVVINFRRYTHRTHCILSAR